MIATDQQGRPWFVAPGLLEPLIHITDPDCISRAEEDMLFAQLPVADVNLGEDNFGLLYDQARDRYEERRL